MSTPPDNSFERYARQLALPQIGAGGQARLQRARALVVGAGGLGCPVLQYIAGAGVGDLTVVDPDTLSIHNLHRQTFFTESDLGRPKAEAIAERLAALNSEIGVSASATALGPGNARALVDRVDLVLDCADSVAVSYILSDTCAALHKPLISASALATSGYVGGFCAGAPSLRSLFPEVPDQLANCNEAGVFGPVVGLIGCAQAQMALAVLLGHRPSPLGTLWQFDGAAFRASSIDFRSAPEPAVVFPFVAPSDTEPTDRVFELRDAGEAPDPAHPLARRIAAHELDSLVRAATAGRTVLCCQSGLRAWRAAAELHATHGGEFALIAASTLTSPRD